MLRICVGRADAHLFLNFLICTIIFVIKQLKRGHVLPGAEFTLLSWECVSTLAGEKPEHPDSLFRTQVAVGKLLLTDPCSWPQVINRNELSTGDKGVEGRMLQEEWALRAEAQKGEGLCHVKFRQPTGRSELLEGWSKEWSQAGWVRCKAGKAYRSWV